MGILMGTALMFGALMRLEPMKFLAHGHRGHRASSAPKGHSIVAQGNALGLMTSPHRFRSPVGATLGYVWPIWGSTCRSWDAPSGHCGSFGDRFPERCPGLRWTAPLVLRIGRLMGTLMGRLMGALMGRLMGTALRMGGADEAGAHDEETWRSGVSAGSETRAEQRTRAERGRTEIILRSKGDNRPTEAH